MTKRITILGSTGSVGRNVLDVVSNHADRFEVVGLSAGCQTETLRVQAAVHPRAKIAVRDREAGERLLESDASLRARSVCTGDDGVLELIRRSEPDLVVNCLLGFAGLRPTLTSLDAGIPVAIANKEAIVTGGALIREACKAGAAVIPIDSEHAAISQCLRCCEPQEVKKVYITSSGGALRDRPLAELGDVAVEDVLAHPNWDMGDKITVDSATLMNKGLEVIEAHWLFDLDFEQIEVIIHPQSVVHSMVEMRDNSILAQMGMPDMRLPILYALTYPERIETDLAPSRIADFPSLTFGEVDVERYPCFPLALEAARVGGNMPTVLNSANEAAVGAYLARKVPFARIRDIIAGALDHIPHGDIGSFDDVAETDRMTRTYIMDSFGV